MSHLIGNIFVSFGKISEYKTKILE
uniref:Uncharacterized protein n=1 Tax=Anguilla anguilla TaxID=7936 RepID=A0A0E9QQM6_ANGAN